MFHSIRCSTLWSRLLRRAGARKGTSMTKHVFYHDRCVDGFTAAWCFWHAQKTAGMGPFVLVPLNYGDWEKVRPRIALTPEDEVLFVDVSIPPADVVKLAAEVKRVHIIDHHKT